MNNIVWLIGRIQGNVPGRNLYLVNDDSTEVPYVRFDVGVTTDRKNSDDQYITEVISCYAEGGIAENMVKYCKEGDLVGVKGELRTDWLDDYKYVYINKVSFLAKKDEVGGESNE